MGLIMVVKVDKVVGLQEGTVGDTTQHTCTKMQTRRRAEGLEAGGRDGARSTTRTMKAA